MPITTRTPNNRDAGRLASGRWADRGACRAPGVNPELFFPIGVRGPALMQIAAAKAVCARCPVTAECLAFALRTGESAGIFGGMTPEERRRQRARLQRSAGQKR